jgi:hydrogenase maturation protease
MPKVLIACIGNIFLGDDGFGVEVARRLENRAFPEGVQVKDFGIRGFDLAFALMDPWDQVVLVDAMEHGRAPGDVSIIQPDFSVIEPGGAVVVETHGMHPSNVLRMIKQMGVTPPPITLLACEPLDFGGEEGQIGLSPVVEAAIQVALKVIDRLLADLTSSPVKGKEMEARRL